MNGDFKIPVDELVEEIQRKSVMINNGTMVHTKKCSRDEAYALESDFSENLKQYGLEARNVDIGAASSIGTMHWYTSKLSLPDKKGATPADIPKQSNLKVFEIRKYDSSEGRENRLTVIMSTEQNEVCRVLEGMTKFYENNGYTKIPGWKNCLDNPETNSKF